MKAKCDSCGFITKLPFHKRNQFRRCYRCGGNLKISYTNKGEYYLQKAKEKKELKLLKQTQED